MKKIFGIILMLPFLVWLVWRIIAGIQFNVDCGGHMKRAADANTIPLAIKEMETVVNYLEAHDMTKGYTSILYRSPSEDVGFWYNNLKSSLEELREISPEATPLEKSNVLMKLRETLLDHGEKGVSITAPSGISIFPANKITFLACIGTILLGIGGVCLFLSDDY